MVQARVFFILYDNILLIKLLNILFICHRSVAHLTRDFCGIFPDCFELFLQFTFPYSPIVYFRRSLTSC
ncbi:unnamed protein product [Meloidogyne enterolobii]|uniref:Uncharacterized protein n=1 Tax=Meloidogyne enterolobii TaxID=390850 RepID=A0ACB1AGJ7_MELEN